MSAGPAHDALSDREHEVLRLLGQGKSVRRSPGRLSYRPKL